MALITGCSTGIGFSTAAAMARAGHEVVAAMRNPDGARTKRTRALRRVPNVWRVQSRKTASRLVMVHRSSDTPHSSAS